MHVVLDARGITAQPAGVGRYAISLVPRMIEQRPDWRFTVLRLRVPRECWVELVDGSADVVEIESTIEIDTLHNHFRGASLLDFAAREHGPIDVFHSLFQVVPVGIGDSVRVVVTAHDFIDMDFPRDVRGNALSAAWLGRYASLAFPHAMRRADRIVAISEHTAARARTLTDAEKVVVIPHGVEPRYFEPPPAPDAIVQYLRQDGWRYIVAVGNEKPYKNLPLLIRAFARAKLPRVRLVIVGPWERLFFDAETMGVKDQVVFPGFLYDEDLRRVLGHADLFVFPSTREGFGMPPLEAMAMGVPTVVSDVEPMRSVAGDAAIRFSPNDEYALTEILRRVLLNPAVAAGMRELGRKHARRFDWNETARETLLSYPG